MSEMSTLSWTATVMHQTTVTPHVVFFAETLDEPGVERRAALPKKDWEDFGSPDVITVTIDPGDILNLKDGD